MPKFRSIPKAIEAVRFDPREANRLKGVRRNSDQGWLDAFCHKIEAGDWLQINSEGYAFYVPDRGDGLAPDGYEPVCSEMFHDEVCQHHQIAGNTNKCLSCGKQMEQRWCEVDEPIVEGH